MRVLVTGAAGMLGSQLLLDAPAGVEVFGTDLAPAGAREGPVFAHGGVDLSEPEEVERLLDEIAPLDAILHCAAYTAVDRAEEEPELAHRVNALAPENVAQAAQERGLFMVLVSTDFVFDGRGHEPYRPTDPKAPLGVYGRTKLEGEERSNRAHPEGLAIVRTQWLYGPRGEHFPGTMLRLASQRDELKVVDDQVGSPTSTLELSPALWDVLRKRATGIYHAACEGRASWYDFAKAILELWDDNTPVHPCGTEEFPRPAPRPAFSVLDCSDLTRLRGRALEPWRIALSNYHRAESQVRHE